MREGTLTFPVTSPDRRVGENRTRRTNPRGTHHDHPDLHQRGHRRLPRRNRNPGPGRHPLSALSNGSLGWLQIANFLVAGALLAIGATGLRRALRGTPGSIWAPRLVRISGIGMIAAGLFVMDPVGGFPAGTPAGEAAALTWRSYAHFAAGSITFTSLIAACYVLGRHFSRIGHRGYAIASRVAGTTLLIGNGWAMGGGKAGTLTLAVGAITAMLSISVIANRYRRIR